MAVYQLIKEQKLQAGLKDVWEFIAQPANLHEITPKHMGFIIISKNLPNKMYPGMIIRYKVRPLLNIPMNWVSEITHIDEFRFFIDIQRSGPYAFWHHQHFLEETTNGVWMRDIVTYKPPYGILGRIANRLFIEKQLEMIFDFRKNALEKRFYPPSTYSNK